jgi:hypothetical protein
MDTEKISNWKTRPAVGDAITVVLSRQPGRCAEVTVRRAGSRRGRRPVGLLYSAKQYDDGLLGGCTGVVLVEDRGLTWAWGWTTKEADALRVAVALARG